MAVAFDAFSVATPGTGDLSWTHTPVGTPTFVLVVLMNSGTITQLNGVTYGGVAMTQHSVSPFSATSTENCILYAYTLDTGIPTGAQTVAADFTTSDSHAAYCLTFTGTGVEVSSSKTDDLNVVANPSTILVATADGVGIGVLGSGLSAVGATAGSGWTALDSGSDLGAMTLYVQRRTVSAGNVTVDWTAASDDAAIMAFGLSEAASGGTHKLAGKLGGKLSGKV